MLKLLLTPILAWLISHTIKVIIFAVKEKKFDIKQFVRAGGMPSGHSATVSALSLAVYFEEGLTSIFVITLIFSIIVIRDTMIRPKEKRHTPLQAFTGLLLGLLISWIIYSI
jgi:acid phosphatase family membrane protein YuiD